MAQILKFDGHFRHCCHTFFKHVVVVVCIAICPNLFVVTYVLCFMLGLFANEDTKLKP